MMEGDGWAANRKVRNHLTGELYDLRPIDGAWAPDSEGIIGVCNEPLVYELFRRRLVGVPYGTEDATGFIEWAERGWREGTHFVLALVSESGSVVGVVDIKSRERECAEIGYWLSEQHRGVMTNAVTELLNIARSMGYHGLYARVRMGNERPAAVLLRAGFVEGAPVEQMGRVFRKFTVQW